uniref:Uncharacterized protein n=1 Tax=Candidatus Kentrum sp. TC TaxID=2126339 RepID=A0A450Z1J2_9GAMM|nr:MAG: hypothetical protein BECKTC1821E_GA0114239_10884 [Candidatus Kentron sp. TC]VFK63057.1 MAG: hypothetical protein BECKTC1821F_GA0114240_10854 [Candidatus Kentron sp. TC]
MNKYNAKDSKASSNSVETSNCINYLVGGKKMKWNTAVTLVWMYIRWHRRFGCRSGSGRA